MPFPEEKHYIIARMFGKMYDKVVDWDKKENFENILGRLRRISRLRPGTYILYEFNYINQYNDLIVYYCPIIGAIDGKTVDVYQPNPSCQYDNTGQRFHYYPQTGEVNFV